MITFTSTQNSIIQASYKEVSWLFEITLDGSASVDYYWSTKAHTFDTQAYTAHILPESFSGVKLARDKIELGVAAPDDLSFQIGNEAGTYTASDFDDAEVHIKCVCDDGTDEEIIRQFRFFIDKAEEEYGVINVQCSGFLQKYLKDDYPHHEVDGLFPSTGGDADDNMAIPVTFGTAYIPIKSAYITDQRYYLIGEAAHTFTIDEVRTPRDFSKISTYPSASYTFNQTSKTDSDSNSWKAAQFIVNDSDSDETADSNGIWMPSGTLLYPLVKFSRTDGDHPLDAPEDCIEFLLEDFGVASADIDTAGTFTTAGTTYSGWNLTFDGGIFTKKPKEEILSNILSMCHSQLSVEDKVRLREISTTSRATITNADIVLNSWSYSPLEREEHDSAYIATPIFDEPQDKLQKYKVTATGNYDNISSDTLEVPFILGSTNAYHTQNAQKVGMLHYELKYLPVGTASFVLHEKHLALEPGDYITINHTLYGGNYKVLIDELEITADLDVVAKVIVFASEPSDWGDLAPSTITPATDDTSGEWSFVTAGPDGEDADGNMPNALPGRLRVGETGNFILLDPADPIIELNEGGTKRFELGKLASSEYGIKAYDSSGATILNITTTDANDTLSGWSIDTEKIYKANAQLHSSGYVSFGPTPPSGFGDNVGAYLGYSSGAKLSLYADGNNYLQWNSSLLLIKAANFELDSDGNITAANATLSGSITATTGSIGGWDIDASKIYKSNAYLHSDGYVSFGPTPPSSYGDNVGAYLGYSSGAKLSLYADGNNYLQWNSSLLLIKAANFELDSSGNITASNATISGAITATSGEIGGFTIDATSLEVGSGATHIMIHSLNGIWLGDDLRDDAPFSVTPAGLLTAESGTIAGWTISADKISKTGIELDSTNQRFKAYTGSNYVIMDASGLTGYDSVFGTTFSLPTDGSAPEFSSGIIKEVEYQIYTSGVIKTADDPSATGGLIINNTDLKGYNAAGTKLLQFVYDGADEGDAYIGDYDNSNAGISYDHSAGTLNIRGTLSVDSLVQLPSDENLVGYWALDDGAGTVAVDSSGNGNYATLSGSPSWTNGPSSKALVLDGSDDYAVVSHDASLNTGNVISVSFWLSPPAAGWGADSTRRGLIDKGDPKSFPNSGASDGWTIGIDRTTNKIVVSLDGISTVTTSTNALTANGSNFVVVSYDDSDLKIYINGVLDSTTSLSAGSLDTAFDLWIGAVRSYSGRESQLNFIDEVRIYDAVLTASEVKALYLYPAGNHPVAISGHSIKTGIIYSDDTNTYFDLNNDRLVFNGKTSFDDANNGIFIGYDAAGYYAFGFGASTGNYLQWDANSGNLNIKGSITITGGSGIASLTDAGGLATADNVDFDSEVTGAEKPENNATVGANWSSNLTNRPTELTDGRITTALNSSGVVISKVIPATVVAPSGAGLYMGSDYLGYYDSSNWKTYMDNSGNFYLGGASGALQWDGTTLSIEGNITVLNPSSVRSDLNVEDGADVTDATNVGAQFSNTLSNIDNRVDEVETALDGSGNLQTKVIGGVTVGASPPEGKGLYLGSDYLGYYSGSAWQTFMNSDGDFYLGGTGGALQWDATAGTLAIEGSITVTGGNAATIANAEIRPEYGFEDGEASDGTVAPSGWHFYNSGGNAGKYWDSGSDNTNYNSQHSYGWDAYNDPTTSGYWNISKYFRLSDDGGTLTVSIEAEVGWSSYSAPGTGQSFYGEDDAYFEVICYDADFDEISDATDDRYSHTASYQNSGESGSDGWYSMTHSLTIPANTVYIQVKVWATDGNNSIQDKPYNGANAGVRFDDFKIIYTKGLVEINGFDSVSGLSSYSANAGTITAGTLSSSDWAAAAGVQLNLDNKWLKMGGSNVTYNGGAAGIFLGYEATATAGYKFYVGDGSNEYFLYNPSDGIELSTAQSDGITIKSGGGLTVESGGDIELIGNDSNPGIVQLVGSGASVGFGITTDGSIALVAPTTANGGKFYIGDEAGDWTSWTSYQFAEAGINSTEQTWVGVSGSTDQAYLDLRSTDSGAAEAWAAIGVVVDGMNSPGYSILYVKEDYADFTTPYSESYYLYFHRNLYYLNSHPPGIGITSGNNFSISAGGNDLLFYSGDSLALTIDSSQHATFADQVAIGGATIGDDALTIDWGPVNNTNACGVQVNYSPSDTSSGSYAYKAIAVDTSEYYAESGVTNSSYLMGLNASTYINNSNHVGTIDSLYGLMVNSGIVSASGNGTVNDVYVIRGIAYFRDSTINDSAYLVSGKLDGAAGGTISGDAYMFYGTWNNLGTVTGTVYGVYVENVEENYIEGDTTFTDDISQGDDDKHYFGASDDSYIQWNPTGDGIFEIVCNSNTGWGSIKCMQAGGSTIYEVLRWTHGNLIVVDADIYPLTDSQDDCGTYDNRWANVYCDNLTETSDVRLKSNIVQSPLGLDFIKSLNVYQYNLRDKSGHYHGMLAQEVQETILNLGYKADDFAGVKHENDSWNLSYTQFVGPLINAVQEVDSEVDQLKKRVKELENEVEMLKAA